MNAVARMVIASGGALKGPATMTEYRLSGGTPERMTPQRQAAIEALDGEQATMRELAAIAGVSEGVLRGLANQGVIEPVTVSMDRPFPPADPDFEEPELTKSQRAVDEPPTEPVGARQLAPFLPEGGNGWGT